MDHLRNLTEEDMEGSIEILPMPRDSNSYGEDMDSQTLPKAVWTGAETRRSTSTQTQDNSVSETETTRRINGENQNIMNISNDLNLPSLQSRNEMDIEQLKADIQKKVENDNRFRTFFIAVSIAVVGALVFQTHQATREMNSRMNIQDERLLNIENNPTVENDDKTDKSFRPCVNDEIRQKIKIMEKEHKALEEDFLSLQRIVGGNTNLALKTKSSEGGENNTSSYIHGHVVNVMMNVLISIIISSICLRFTRGGITSLTGRMESCLQQVKTVDESTKKNIDKVETNGENIKTKIGHVEAGLENLRKEFDQCQVKASDESQITKKMQNHLSAVKNSVEEITTRAKNLQQAFDQPETQPTEKYQRVDLNVNEVIEKNGTSIRHLQHVLDESKTQTTKEIQSVEFNVNKAIEGKERQLQAGIGEVKADLMTTNDGLGTLTIFKNDLKRSVFSVQLKRDSVLENGRNKLNCFDRHIIKCDHFDARNCSYTVPVTGNYVLGGNLHQNGFGQLNLYAVWGDGNCVLLAKTTSDYNLKAGSVVRTLTKGEKVSLEVEQASKWPKLYSCDLYGHFIG